MSIPCSLYQVWLHIKDPAISLFFLRLPLLSAGFLCRLEPYLYGVCERRILPGTAPHLCGEVNRLPPEGLRYPETPLTAGTLGTADTSKVLSGISRSPWRDCPAPSRLTRQVFVLYFLLQQPITNSSPEWGKLIGWLLDSLSIFFPPFLIILNLFVFHFYIPEYCGLVYPFPPPHLFITPVVHPSFSTCCPFYLFNHFLTT